MKRIYCILSLLITLSAVQAQAQAHKPLAKKSAGGGLAASVAAGQQVYTLYCLTCHQADGGGVQNMNPPLVKTTYVLGDKGKLIKIVLNGLTGAEVDGDTYTNAMPSLSILKDQEIADVLTYVRNSFTNKAPAVTVAEVKKARATAAK